MALLLIDTSTARCAVLVRTGGSDTQKIETGTRGQDARLAPMVQDVLGEAKIAPKDIARIGVIVGPGAFTGVRIGVAFARGLGLALDVPVGGINTLDVFALSCGAGEYCVGVCDIGRDELAYRFAQNGLLQGDYETAPAQTVLSLLRSFAKDKTVYLAGPAARQISEDCLHACGQSDLDLARTADLLEAAHLPALDALPWYHRPPDAKLPGDMAP